MVLLLTCLPSPTPTPQPGGSHGEDDPHFWCKELGRNTDFVFRNVVYFDFSGSFLRDHCRSLPILPPSVLVASVEALKIYYP